MPSMPGMKDCAMGRHAPSCGMTASTPLSLPASLVPVAPLPARVTGIPRLAPLARLRAAALLPALTDTLPAVFHPPNL